jgi:hypothetical protein
MAQAGLKITTYRHEANFLPLEATMFLKFFRAKIKCADIFLDMHNFMVWCR